MKSSSVHMKFHFGCISKQPDVLMDMCKHFISGIVYMISYHPKWSFISVKMTTLKSIPALSFKLTCALNAKSNESVLIQFLSGKLCSHENLMSVWNFISVKMTDMKHILPQFMRTHVKSWLNTEVRFSTEMKSHIGLSSFRLSCERTPRNDKWPWRTWHKFKEKSYF